MVCPSNLKRLNADSTSGLYTALFAGSVYVLAFERPKKHYLATSIVLYVAITIITSLRSAQVIIVPSDLTNSYLVGGVSYSCHSIPQTPPMVRGHMAIDLINVFIDIMNAISQVAADGLLIYRCFIIWNRRIRVVLLSIVLLLATTACNLAHVYYDYQLYETIRHGPTKRSLGRSHILSMATVFDTANSLLALSTTVLTTALTAGRIWWISKQLGRDFGMSVGGIYRSAITLVVESGALYSSGQIAQLIVQKSAPQYEGITNYCVSPLLVSYSVRLCHYFCPINHHCRESRLP
ncbi:hypothetical protein DENSPDRAFT_167421 [Dentipellis sp. KUC8613]|nr:hypothetical protein DENSPDRAFT_167421 [Dentipellis sp. KUC8613]